MTEAASPQPEPADEPRWQAYLRRSAVPLFLLNRQRRLRFANRAWEECTGLDLAAVRGRPCRAGNDREPRPVDVPLAALAPPAAALAGQTCRVRRRAPAPATGWWQLDFFPLPVAPGLLGILGKITPLSTIPPVLAPLPGPLMALRDRQAEAFRLDAPASELPVVRRLLAQARLAATGRMPVTLVGAAGTGKHWLARAIHEAGPGRERCFAQLDCRALPPPLLAELLLEPRGRRLALGTVYLGAPAELPRELQDRLAQQLRSDDDGEAPRLIVGHRTDPAELVRAGRLLEELHCAASTLTIALPPLRERLADLDGFIGVFLDRARLLTEHAVSAVGPEALAALRSHDWPGNLRELYEVLRGACARAKDARIELADLPFFLRHAPLPAEKPLPLDALLEQAERRLILVALRQAGGNRTRAAEILGIWRPRLLRRLAHFGLDPGGADADQEGPAG